MKTLVRWILSIGACMIAITITKAVGVQWSFGSFITGLIMAWVYRFIEEFCGAAFK